MLALSGADVQSHCLLPLCLVQQRFARALAHEYTPEVADSSTGSSGHAPSLRRSSSSSAAQPSHRQPPAPASSNGVRQPQAPGQARHGPGTSSGALHSNPEAERQWQKFMEATKTNEVGQPGYASHPSPPWMTEASSMMNDVGGFDADAPSLAALRRAAHVIPPTHAAVVMPMRNDTWPSRAQFRCMPHHQVKNVWRHTAVSGVTSLDAQKLDDLSQKIRQATEQTTLLQPLISFDDLYGGNGGGGADDMSKRAAQRKARWWVGLAGGVPVCASARVARRPVAGCWLSSSTPQQGSACILPLCFQPCRVRLCTVDHTA